MSILALSTNSDPVDTIGNPVRSAIYQYDLEGLGGRIFARGIRNAEGLAFVPGTDELWAAVNETDDLHYPFRDGWHGAGSYGDNHPPRIHSREGRRKLRLAIRQSESR